MIADTSKKRMSLHIGVNVVDPQRYMPPPKTLENCEADAEAMERVARSRGFDTNVLLSQDATEAAVLGAIADIAGQLRSGDFFFLTYAGHGGQVDDLDGDEATESMGKPDTMDETWLLYDKQLRDDDIFDALMSFEPGVRVFFMSDSCHSGTIARGDDINARLKALEKSGIRARWAPPDVTFAEFDSHREEYKSKASQGKRASLDDSRVPVILLSGCQDDQLSDDGEHNGAFTASFLRAWGDGTFVGDYQQLSDVVTAGLPPWQVPNLFPFGAGVHELLASTPLAD